MAQFGLREIVGVAGLLAAVGIAVTFITPTEGKNESPGVIHLGLPVTPTPTPDPNATPTPTPVVAQPAPAPESWLVRLYRGLEVEQSPVDSLLSFDSLEMSYSGGPFPDLPDNNWSMTAEATLSVKPGRWEVAIEHQGALRILIDGKEVASEPGGGKKVLRAQFDTDRPIAEIRIEAKDTGGTFSLRWLK